MARDNTFLLLLAGAAALVVLTSSARTINANLQAPPIPKRKPTFTTGPSRQVSVDLNSLYLLHGRQKGVDWRLLKAIAIVESNENPSAKNPTDPSLGLMQVRCVANCSTCKCTNTKHVQGWQEATPDRLFEPDFNVHIASQILKWNLDTYGFMKGIAIYNNFSARFDPDQGPFRNQGYVNKVLREFRSL